MADSDSNASVRFNSWVSLYKDKARETSGSIQVIMKGKLSILNPLPGNYAKNSEKFESMVASYSDGNFLLIPAGGNKVRIIHHCFVHGDPGGTTVVVGISGTRRTSPFKIVKVGHAVSLNTKPRAT
jgi:hypothetical protein